MKTRCTGENALQRPTFATHLCYFAGVQNAVDWDDLRIFLALRRERTFSGAARALKVNATTVSRRLARLEEQLGTLLFQRTPDALVPTREAEAILDSVEHMERQAGLVVNQIAGRDAVIEGVVRLATTRQFARDFLLEHLAPLSERHPAIQLQLVAGDQRADLTRDEADLAIRFQKTGGAAPAEAKSHVDIRALKVGTIGVGVYASRGYVERVGHPKSADAMSGHDLIVCSDEASHIPGRAWMDRVKSDGRVALRVDVGTMSAAVGAGFGVGAILSFYAARQPSLVHVTPPALVDSRDVWLLMPSDLVRVARVRAVWDYLVETLAAARSQLSGEPQAPRVTRAGTRAPRASRRSSSTRATAA